MCPIIAGDKKAQPQQASMSDPCGAGAAPLPLGAPPGGGGGGACCSLRRGLKAEASPPLRLQWSPMERMYRYVSGLQEVVHKL